MPCFSGILQNNRRFGGIWIEILDSSTYGLKKIIHQPNNYLISVSKAIISKQSPNLAYMGGINHKHMGGLLLLYSHYQGRWSTTFYLHCDPTHTPLQKSVERPSTQPPGNESDGFSDRRWLPSGKHTKSYWKWPLIVDFPIKNDDFPPLIVDFPMKNDDFPPLIVDFPMKNDDFP